MSNQILDRVTMVDENGRVFFFEPPNTTVYELFDRNLEAPERSINRVSNCEWAFWAVTSDFEVVLYVYQRLFPIQAEVATYENQVGFNIILVLDGWIGIDREMNKFAMISDLFSFWQEELG